MNDPLAPRPMSPEQIRDLVVRTRQSMAKFRYNTCTFGYRWDTKRKLWYHVDD